MWQEETFILGKSSRKFAIVSVRNATLGHQDRCISTQCKRIRFAFHTEQSHISEMATRTNYEWVKMICMKMKNVVFLNRVSFLPFLLRKLPDAFGLTGSKSRYPHYRTV